MEVTGEIQNIPLDRLILSELNPRLEEPVESEIEALATSIETIGLQQNLIGLACSDSNVEIVGGGRRLRALNKLVERGSASGSTEIPVTLCKGIDHAMTAAVAENEARSQLSVYDQFIAFRKLSDNNIPVSDIAVAFATDTLSVRRVLALRNASGLVLEALKKDQITLDMARAFLSGHPHVQDMAFREMQDRPGWSQNPTAIRNMIRRLGDVGTMLAKLAVVGRDNYLEANGSLTEDLFSDEILVDDPEILDKLFDESIRQSIENLQAEGWHNAFFVHDQGEQAEKMRDMQRIFPKRAELSDDDLEWVEAVSEQYDSLDDMTPEDLNRYVALTADQYSPDQKSVGTMVLSLSLYGEGLNSTAVIEPENIEHAIELGVARVPSDPLNPGEPPEAPETDKTSPDVLPGKLVGELNSLRALLVGEAIAGSPETALDVLAWSQQFSSYASPSSIVVREGNQSDAAALGAERSYESAVDSFGTRGESSFEAYRKQGKRTRNIELARMVGASINTESMNMHDPLAEIEDAMKFRLRDHWTPGDEFFKRLSVKQLEALYRELTGVNPPTIDTKKATQVSALSELFADPKAVVTKLAKNNPNTIDKSAVPSIVEAVKEWLPAPLRRMEPVTPDDFGRDDEHDDPDELAGDDDADQEGEAA